MRLAREAVLAQAGTGATSEAGVLRAALGWLDGRPAGPARDEAGGWLRAALQRLAVDGEPVHAGGSLVEATEAQAVCPCGTPDDCSPWCPCDCAKGECLGCGGHEELRAYVVTVETHERFLYTYTVEAHSPEAARRLVDEGDLDVGKEEYQETTEREILSVEDEEELRAKRDAEYQAWLARREQEAASS